MSNEPKVLLMIPARGGSKRLPRKNILDLKGLPLIAYSIQSVKNASKVTDWLVSSDDDEIINVAKQYNAPVYFKRPVSLSGDDVRNIDVMLHSLNFMENKNKITYDILILLQPTSPIRLSEHIDEAIEKLWDSDLPTLASVKGPYQKRDPILKKLNGGGELVSYRSDESGLDSREPFYIYNAALYAVKRDYFVEQKTFVSSRQVPLFMDKYHSVDVDEISDFLVAKTYIEYLESINSKEER